ncbi:MAG: hypothetical protein JOZ96_09600 [Acidobacteria bacterium]|nr:hypothetical protein [Acidobacteriota bacterium]
MDDIVTLLTNPTATITLDGLMILSYNKASRVCQVGVHTQAEKHEVRLAVLEVREGETVREITKEVPWNGSHENVKAISPLWLYVDSGNGRRPEEFSAALHQPGDKQFSQSFGNVLDFEGAGLYNRKLDFKPTTFAVLNIANGLFYSSANTKVALKKFGQNEDSDSAVPAVPGSIVISSLAAADITALSEPGQGEGQPEVVRHLVLEQENPKQELFRRKLEAGKHYVLRFVNGPKPEPKPQDGGEDDGHEGHVGHEGHDEHAGHGGDEGNAHHVNAAEHFLQFYEMFSLLPDEKKFLVVLPPTGDDTTDAPPCNVGQAGSGGGL